MKRTLIYLSVIIGCLFIGLTTYYFLKNYEYISVTASSGDDEIFLNILETEELTIIHENPHGATELSSVIDDNSIISFDIETGIIAALKGGKATLTISSTNENFGPFTFTIYVGDGTNSITPYYIKTADDLKAVGRTRIYSTTVSRQWSLDSQYLLIEDIDLEGDEWMPIGTLNTPFTGEFNGSDFKISNFQITTDMESAGLFGAVGDFAIISSLKIDSLEINGIFDYAGAVAGVSLGSTISKIEITNTTILTAPTVFTKNNAILAYGMTGGVVGACDIEVWEEAQTTKDGYAYSRTTITMISFQGTVGAREDCLDIVSEVDQMYLTYGGIVGYNLGGIIFNTKAEVVFSFDAEFAGLSITAEDEELDVIVGGIVGLVDIVEITQDNKIPPIVKNNLAIVTFDNLTNTFGGVAGAVPLSVQYAPGVQFIIGNYFYTDNSNLTSGGSTFPNATTKIATLSNLKKQLTYKTDAWENWDIGDSLSVWLIEEGVSAPAINFTGVEQEVVFEDEIYEIATAADFKKYYDKMLLSEQAFSRKFWLSQSYLLKADINLADTGITEWTPIGYDHLFRGTFDGGNYKLYFENESGTEIKFINTLIDGEYKYRYGAIFANIAVGAEVRNLKVQGFNVNYADYAGGIAGINQGKIINCIVEDITIQNAKNAGFIAAYNSGIIQNTVESEEIVYSVVGMQNQMKILPTQSYIFAGGITGYNTGIIDGIKIEGVFEIVGEITTALPAGNIHVFGGAVGYNSGNISNSAVEGACVFNYSKIKLLIGGFCGINEGVIKTSHAGTGADESGLKTEVKSNMSEGQQIAGGFVAVLGYNGVIEKCFANVTVSGYYAAGLAADLLGTASECYVKGKITGEYIGGFACNLAFKGETRGGKISNSYTMVDLIGNSDDSIAAGLATFIRSPGVIENCFASNTFSGSGIKCYESYTDTRSTIAQKVDSLGQVKGIVINIEAGGQENTEVERNGEKFLSIAIDDPTQVVYYLDNITCLSGKQIYENIGFAVGPTAYWTINEGFYPILTNLELDGISQLPQDEGEIPEETPPPPEG